MDFLCYPIPLAKSSEEDCPPVLAWCRQASTGEEKKEAKIQSYVVFCGGTSVTSDGGKRTLTARDPRFKQSHVQRIREAGLCCQVVSIIQILGIVLFHFPKTDLEP